MSTDDCCAVRVTLLAPVRETSFVIDWIFTVAPVTETSESVPDAVRSMLPPAAFNPTVGAVAVIDEPVDVSCTALAPWISTFAALVRVTPVSPLTVSAPPIPPATNVHAPAFAQSSAELAAAAQAVASDAPHSPSATLQVHTSPATALCWLQPSSETCSAQLRACVAAQLCSDTLAWNVASPPLAVTVADCAAVMDVDPSEWMPMLPPDETVT